MTIREEASVRLAQNLRKVVKVALINYNKQSAFYRHCNPVEQHVERMIAFFFRGFYQEVKAERSAQIIATPSTTLALSFHSQPVGA